MKLCGQCQETKLEGDFGWKNKAKGWRQAWCKPCNREYQKQHYRENKDAYRAKARAWDAGYLEEIYVLLREYFRLNPCVDCNMDDARVLEFDHVRGEKAHNISDMIRNKVSWPKILVEIEKCDVRCRNCHAIVTYERVGSRRSLWI